MGKTIDADAAKLAGLQIDLLQKWRSGAVTLEHLEGFLNLSATAREVRFGNWKVRDNPKKAALTFDAELLAMGYKVEHDPSCPAITKFDPRITLYCPLAQGESSIGGEERRARLRALFPSTRLFGAEVTRFLLKNQDKIPEEWRDKYITFDGNTIVTLRTGERRVQALLWGENCREWCTGSRLLTDDFDGQILAAVLALS